MPDNNAKNDNYNAEKEIMKINNVDIPKEKWGKGIDILYRTTDNIIFRNKNNKNEYRDYKQLNLDAAKDFLNINIDTMNSSSILNKINKDFINRKENKVLLISIDLFFLNKLKELQDKGLMNIENYNLDKFDERIMALFNRDNGQNESIIDKAIFVKNYNPEGMEIRKQMVPVLKRLIDNLDKNEIGFFDWFLKKNKI